jgi:4-amino-4-deoxy-L-arabinose transferase-like glycosyltransferase
MSARVPASRRFAVALCLILVGLAYTYRLGSPPLFDDPNDGQYAEVAREMLESGDWVSPQLDYALFLNKPPLLYWLVAASYSAFGVGEAAARLPGVLVTLATLVLLYLLGRELFDRTTGALAALLYGALPGTLIEARFVRPDALLVASVVGSLLAFAVAARSDGAARRRALYAFQVAVAVGLMAKGIVGILLPAMPVAAVAFGERRRDLLRMLLAPRSWLLLLALVTPWHVAVAVRHEGFLWDYIVNQHLLFFLDLKQPRDSIPIPLGDFWMAFLLHALPWTLLLPAVLIWSVRHAREPQGARSYRIPLAWAAGTMLFFSAATSRLEHYCLPAVPAVVLLVVALLRHGTGEAAPWRKLVVAHFALLAALCLAALWLAPPLLGAVEWLSGRTELPSIARVFFAGLGLAALAAALVFRYAPALCAALPGAAVLAFMPAIHAGVSALAPIDSSKPVADVLKNTPAYQDSTIVFEAPFEYQICAGLNFYLHRRIRLLRPAGFVDPPYLAPHSRELFIERDELNRLWTSTPVLFVSDPLQPMTRSVREIVPAPLYIVARTYDRWVLSNQPVR